MSIEPSPPHEDLFYEDLIRSYVEAPRFIARPWLVHTHTTFSGITRCGS